MRARGFVWSWCRDPLKDEVGLRNQNDKLIRNLITITLIAKERMIAKQKIIVGFEMILVQS
jgi:hypothetical protein